jgi:hypothetical protein
LAFLVDAALQRHPARTLEPENAQVFLALSFAALSIASGTCNGESHFGRMLATSAALKSQSWFQARPQGLLLLNGVASPLKNPLGELGQLVSSRGGHAACFDSKLCGFFVADRILPVPWMVSSAALRSQALRTQVDDEACGRRAPGGRTVSLLFRGTIGATKYSQELRVRLLMLRQALPDATVTVIGNEKLLPGTAQYLSKNKLTMNRLKRMEGINYVRALQRAKFCLAPAGDVATPGQRLFDAISAGCVPILIGVDQRALPLARQLDYARFSASISRSAFMRDPAYACEALLHKLEPQLGAMQRALADARGRLLYGFGNDVPRVAWNSSLSHSFGTFGPMLLREFQDTQLNYK